MKRIIIFLTVLVTIAYSQSTLPTDHWVYESIRKLQISGYFSSLDQGGAPYTRQEMGMALASIDSKFITKEINRVEYDRLNRFFQFKGQPDEEDLMLVVNPSLITSSHIENQFDQDLKLRLKGSMVLNKNFVFNYTAALDSKYKDDDTYSGYEWRGLTGVQEQMYMAYVKKNLIIKFGRDYVKWGYGRTGNLMISDNSRPFDMVSLQLKSKYLSMQAFTSQLDKMYQAERYLTAIRFETKIKQKLYIGIGQCAIYGGENRPVDFTISNPLAFYSFTQDNDHKSMNMMLYMDFAYRFFKSNRLYGEILIDDFQIDKEIKSDLEPNEIGILFGLESNNLPLNYTGWIEFVQVRNRTYNVPNERPFEKFLHKNQYIGHQLGTDFQSLQLEVDRWLNSYIELGFGYQLLRQGEGTVRGEFTTPYLEDDVTMESGYSEKIPYGIVETTNKFYGKVKYDYNQFVQCDLFVGLLFVDNLKNIRGRSKSDIFGSLNLWIDYTKIFLIK